MTPYGGGRSTYCRYALILKDGSRVTPIKGWYRNEEGELVKDERFFFWVGKTHDIGTFSDYEMALKYMQDSHLRGVWASRDCGGRGDDFYPIEEIRGVEPWGE